MAARLSVTVDHADVTAALGTIKSQIVRFYTGVRTLRERDRAHSNKTLQEERRDSIRAANDRMRVAKAAQEAQTAITKAEAAKRTTATSKESDARTRSGAAQYSALLAAERGYTAAVVKGAADRERVSAHEASQLARRAREARALLSASRANTGNRGAGGGGARTDTGASMRTAGRFASAVSSGLDGVAGDVNAARRGYAGRETTLNRAFQQAGASVDDLPVLRSMVNSYALRTGADGDDIAAGLLSSQSTFNTLTGRDPKERQRRLMDAMQNVEIARQTQQSPSELLRLGGMLSQQGITGTSQRAALLQMSGIANTGAIELQNIGREAMGPLMQNIALATNSSQTPAQRASAVAESVRRTMAVAEVGASAGLSARDSMNAYSKVTRAFSNDRTTNRLYETLRGRAHGEETVAQMFETVRDDRGHSVHRLRNRDPLQTISDLNRAFGGDTTGLLNTLQRGAGGMILDSQARRLVGGLTSQTEGGESVRDRVNRIQGASFGEAELTRGGEIVDSSIQTQINRAEERRQQGLLGSNEALSFTENLESIRSNHPFLARVAEMLPANVGQGGMQLGAAAMTAIDSGLGNLHSPFGGSGQAIGAAHGPAGKSNAIGVDLSPDSIARLARALRDAPLRATIDPHDAAQHRSAGATGNAPPPEGRH